MARNWNMKHLGRARFSWRWTGTHGMNKLKPAFDIGETIVRQRALHKLKCNAPNLADRDDRPEQLLSYERMKVSHSKCYQI